MTPAQEKFLLQEAARFAELLRYLRTVFEDGLPKSMEDSMIKFLDASLPFFTNLTLRARFPQIMRLTNSNNKRLENKRIHRISDLKAPPAQVVKWYNRCCRPGQTMFYGAFSPMTLINETTPALGELVTRSTW